MSKSRNKAAGCTRGRYKRKNMGKGWLLARRVPNTVKPLVRNDAETSVSREQPEIDAKGR